METDNKGFALSSPDRVVETCSLN